jgi:hypothetical protein
VSSPTEFFDVVYLGIFIILSPAFDGRFYQTAKPPPPTLVDEVAYAVGHFQSLLNIFTKRFIILLDGKAISPLYTVNRMLAEFAAAAVVFAQDIHEYRYEGNDDGDYEDGIGVSKFRGEIECILQGSCPEVFAYYSCCLKKGHKHFLWTGPEVQILPRSSGLSACELRDLPGHSIYDPSEISAALTRSLSAAPPTITPLRRARGSSNSQDMAGPQAKRFKR